MQKNVKPNILWVFSDQHRPQAMGCYGDTNIETPNFDRLAMEGIRFNRAYSNTPLCSPFRATVYTGKYIHKHGVTALSMPINNSQRMLAQELKEHGYHTAHFGKWHLAGGVSGQHYVAPYFRPGWDDWLGFENSNVPFATRYSDDRKGNKPQIMDGYQTDILTDFAIEWLENFRKTKPWFLTLSIEAPHPPHEAPQKYKKIFADQKLKYRQNVPLEHKDFRFFEESLRGYYAQIKNLDDNIGRILATLEDKGALENTIIFYFSDHGDLMGSHGMMQKQRPEEESSRIPLIIRLPGDSVNGSPSDQLISGVDLAPTLLGLLGESKPDYMQGRDFSDHIMNSKTDNTIPVILQYEKTRYELQNHKAFRTIIMQEYKYTYFLNSLAQLFNLETDPYEMDNLINNVDKKKLLQHYHSELVKELIRIEDFEFLKTMNVCI